MYSSYHTVGPKGQVVIPEQLREEAGIFPGSKVAFDFVEGRVVVIPAQKSADEVMAEIRAIAGRCKLAGRLSNRQVKGLILSEVEERHGLR